MSGVPSCIKGNITLTVRIASTVLQYGICSRQALVGTAESGLEAVCQIVSWYLLHGNLQLVSGQPQKDCLMVSQVRHPSHASRARLANEGEPEIEGLLRFVECCALAHSCRSLYTMGEGY